MRAIPVLFAVMILTGCSLARHDIVAPGPYRNWESNSVVSNGIRLHYWRTGGEGKPVVVMARGITDFGLN